MAEEEKKPAKEKVKNPEFHEYYERLVALGMDQPVLCVALGLQRSTLGKWVDGSVTQIPAVAITAVRMLWFMAESDKELFKRWLIMQEFGVPAQYATETKASDFLFKIGKPPSPPVQRFFNKYNEK